MASNEPHDSKKSLRGIGGKRLAGPTNRSLDLFGGDIFATTKLDRYARIAAELLHSSTSWISCPGQTAAHFPSTVPRKLGAIDLPAIVGSVFPGGMPNELTILPDLDEALHVAASAHHTGLLIAAPLVSSAGNTLGVMAVADEKMHRLTARQIDAFKDIVALVSAEVETVRRSEVPLAQSFPVAATLAGDFLEHCAYPAWLVDPVSEQFVALNENAVKKYGYSRDDFLKLNTGSLLADEDVFDRTKADHSPRQVTHRSKDGLLIDSEIIALDVLFEGTPARLELMRDVSAWRRVEDRSRFQSSVLSQISDAVIAVDLNHRVTYWNHVAEQMYEYKSREVLGERLPDLLQPLWPSDQEERDASTTLLASGRWTGETVHHRRSGETLHVESSVTAIKNNEHRQIGFLCLNRDITERKKMEKTLLESEQRYRSLFDFHPDAVVLIDPDGKFLSANLACRSIFGFVPDEMTGKSFLPMVDPKDRIQVLGHFERAIHGEPVSYEYMGLQKNGKKVNLAAVALPVIVDGQIIGVYCISHDISEHKRLQSIISGENEVLQWLAANKPLASVIDRLLGHIEERYESVICAVTVFTEDGKPQLICAPGMPLALRKTFGTLEDDVPRTTVAEALATRKPVICKNIATDLVAADQREIAKISGQKAVCSVPILGTSGPVLGTISLYFRESREPSAEELNIAERAAALLRVAIENDRAHIKLSLTERAMDSSVASVMITDPRKPGRPIIYANTAFENITGYKSADVLGKNPSILYGEQTDPDQLREIDSAVSAEHECNVLIKYYTAAGEPFWSSSSISPVRDKEGRLTHYIEVQNDVTPLIQALDAVRESEQRFRQLIENASDMVVVLEQSGIIRYISPAVERILGYQPEDVQGRDIFEFVHPDELVLTRTIFLQLLQIPEELMTIEMRVVRADGSWCHIEVTGQNLLNKPGVRGVVINARDLSERKQANDRLDHLAYHDVLTDLPNRLMFNDHLTKSIANAKRRSAMVAVLFLDLDRFKVINDTLGHSVGDELLQQVARRLVATSREGDTIARWGGDEFTVILLTIANSRDAARAATRIINSLGEPFHVAGHELYITATVGISMFPAAGEDVETLVRNADTAMYRAKEEGQNHYQFYTPKMNAGASERLALEGHLRRALEREEFVLYYQPQVESLTGRIVGAEALVRWQHPDLGLVPPKEFIPLAEETGLIVPIGEWIMNRACIQARKWQDANLTPLKIAVNLSARQFSQRDLQAMIQKAIRDSGADPNWIELELTESMLMNCENRVINSMKDLAASGISITIDDFGVGYSSYSYLKRYPVSALKIEQSFVRGMLVDAHDNAIVQSVIAMAHKLNLRVIAEGVETKEQSDALVASRCNLLQGYYYGKPAPAEDFFKLLLKQSPEQSTLQRLVR